MSIRIIKDKCVACNKCIDVCPGSLIYKDEDKKMFIKYPKDCWGCTACLKQCNFGAIKYFLGADIGGEGGSLYTKDEGNYLHWHITDKLGKENIITIDKRESNKY